jgi:anti-sigma factor RsiW
MKRNMNQAAYEKLKETAWQRNLTRVEQAELQAVLSAHPESKADWNDEAMLNRALGQLPDAPVSSNFTARVVQGVEMEFRRNHRPRHLWSVWLPRFALASFALCVGFFSLYEYRLGVRKAMAQSVATVSNAAAAPRIEWLKNFETINRLNQVAPVDEDLLAMLK